MLADAHTTKFLGTVIIGDINNWMTMKRGFHSCGSGAFETPAKIAATRVTLMGILTTTITE
jgi:hypothetical protein